MKTFKYLYSKACALLCALCLLCALGVTSSCEDMLDKGNEYVIYDEGRELVNPADTVNSLLGILNKLQAIAVRTNLFGDLRADMVSLRDNATTDLKDIAALNITDDNKYNAPRDYYAVINNCNYFLAHADSTVGNPRTGRKYFKAEIAQVHSIRAWTYLQLVLVYGRVPFVDKPIVTKLESEAQYPIWDLAQICDYFIRDLERYDNGGNPTDYPNFLTLDTGFDPLTCMFPTQLVLGDLYLWRAVANQNKEDAKKAAKSYYNYIVWRLYDENGRQLKSNKMTGYKDVTWSSTQLKNNRYSGGPLDTYSSKFYDYKLTWGSSSMEISTVIPMDSAAADGFYNELRRFYNTSKATEWEEACISPSQVLRDLSKQQIYYGVGETTTDTVKVTADKLTDEEISKGYLGDLRLAACWKQSDYKDGLQLVNYQTVAKHRGQHVIIYHTSQIYLRLAEALNYAGYPRFARQILTMGLSNNVINAEVRPYYPEKEDSLFIDQFDFNSGVFLPIAGSYTEVPDEYGFTKSAVPSYQSSVNMEGVHSMGSGLSYYDLDYVKLEEPDYSALDAIPVVVAPTPMDEPWTLSQMTSDEFYAKSDDDLKLWWSTTVGDGRETADFDELKTALKDSVDDYVTYLADLASYKVYRSKLKKAHDEAYKALVAKEQVTVDKAILDEQALELSFEGNRYYDLMRRSLWWGDNTLANAVSKRDAAVGASLMSRQNWYLKWKGKIGY